MLFTPYELFTAISADSFPADGYRFPSPSSPLSTALFRGRTLTAYRPGVQTPPEERGLLGLRGIVGLSASAGRPSGLDGSKILWAAA